MNPLVVGRITELVPYEKTIREYRAPTDESIELFAEMLSKAESFILHKIHPTENRLGIAAVIFRDHIWDGIRCRYKVDLNGEIIESEIEIDGFRYPTLEDKMRMIYESVSSHIAKKVCEEIWEVGIENFTFNKGP